MRAILRIEVEAVRFLKEEPHRLDSLLFSGTQLCHHLEIDSLLTGEGDVGGISAPLKSF